MAMITLTDAENGATRLVRPGDDIEVILSENPTTGYRWQVDRADGPVRLEQTSFRPDPGGRIGRGGMRAFLFRATGPGAAQISLKHWQEWEGDRSIVARFAATIDIVD